MKKIIFPVILAVIVCAAGYLIFFRNAGPTLSDQAYTNPEEVTEATSTEDAEAVVSKPEVAANDKSTNSIIDNTKIMSATLHTSMGDITIEFNKDATPNTVANFVKLAQAGFYDGTKFHRVIKGFMNQGGDPLSKDDSKYKQWGMGGPGYKFDDEITSTNSNDVGTIAMANAGPNTNGSQFFINAAPNHSLDTKHTVFGKVTAGLDVVMAINSTPTDAHDQPLTPVVIKSITLK
jgi:cyclophilin family peptidyl-prolyl cis-trans isomerase